MGATLSYTVRGQGLNARRYYLNLQTTIHTAPHVLRSDPDHRHDGQGGVEPSPAMDVPDVLEAVLQVITPSLSGDDRP